jgi:hypothetical protein
MITRRTRSEESFVGQDSWFWVSLLRDVGARAPAGLATVLTVLGRYLGVPPESIVEASPRRVLRQHSSYLLGTVSSVYIILDFVWPTVLDGF